jgi:hypothetical protein
MGERGGIRGHRTSDQQVGGSNPSGRATPHGASPVAPPQDVGASVSEARHSAGCESDAQSLIRAQRELQTDSQALIPGLRPVAVRRVRMAANGFLTIDAVGDVRERTPDRYRHSSRRAPCHRPLAHAVFRATAARSTRSRRRGGSQLMDTSTGADETHRSWLELASARRLRTCANRAG